MTEIKKSTAGRKAYKKLVLLPGGSSEPAAQPADKGPRKPPRRSAVPGK